MGVDGQMFNDLQGKEYKISLKNMLEGVASEELIGLVVPVFDAREYVRMDDPSKLNQAIGFARINNDLTISVKFIAKGKKVEQEIDGGFKLFHIGRRTVDGRFVIEAFRLSYQSKEKSVGVSEEKYADKYKDVLVEKAGELYLKRPGKLMKFFGKYLSKGDIIVKASMGKIVIENVKVRNDVRVTGEQEIDREERKRQVGSK